MDYTHIYKLSNGKVLAATKHAIECVRSSIDGQIVELHFDDDTKLKLL
jgi:hypothetical protein